MINCPWCKKGFEPTGDGRCPYCGTVPPAGEKPKAEKPPEPAPEQPQPSIFDAIFGGPEGRGLPWERRAEVGFMAGLLTTARGVLLSPLGTFRAMKRKGSPADPFLFALLLGTVGLAAAACYGALGAHALREMGGDISAGAVNARLLSSLTWAPVAAVLAPTLAALISHLTLMAFGPVRGTLEGSWRAACYASGGAALLCLIPICGSPLFLLWYVAAAAVGLNSVHRSKLSACLIAAAVPALLVVLGCCGLIFFPGTIRVS